MTSLRKKSDLRPYQVYMAKKIKGRKTVLLAADMGLGKSAATLTAVRRLLDEFAVRRVLVIAPLYVAEETWPEEIAAWAHTKALQYSVITGTPKQRMAALEKDVEIHIINRENLPWLWRTLGKKKWKYDMLVYDESSRLKSGKKRTKGGKNTGRRLSEFGALANARHMAEYVVELTGTPAPNGLIDLWGQIYILDLGERLGGTKAAFHDRWFDSDYMGWTYTPKPHAEEEIMERISDVMIGLRAEDYLDLPPVVSNTIRVKLPKKVMEEYRRFERTLVSEAYDVEAVSKGVLTNKLLQFCIAKDTEVLTPTGWVEIQKIRAGQFVWDGFEWVSCAGSVFKGIKSVVTCYGVRMTPQHEVLTVEGWKTAEEILDRESCERFDREEVWIPDCFRASGAEQAGPGAVAGEMLLRQQGDSTEPVPSIETSGSLEILRVQTWRKCIQRGRRAYDDWLSTLGYLATDEESLPRSRGEGLPQLRRPRHRYARRVVCFIQGFLGGCQRGISTQSDDRPRGQQQRIFQRQLSMGESQDPASQYPRECLRGKSMGAGDDCRGGRAGKHSIRDVLQESGEGLFIRGPVRPREIAVYDILNCGPRSRFTVRGTDGRSLIVHNCNGSMYRDIEDSHPRRREIVQVHDMKIAALESVVEEANGNSVLLAYSFKFDLERIKKKYPKAVIAGEDKNWKKDWDKGRIKLLAAHPASIGHGLNLQYGGHIACWYGLTWSLELYQQFNKRLPRPGQKNHCVYIHHIIAAGTADEDVLASMSSRGATQDSITEAVRKRLRAS